MPTQPFMPAGTRPAQTSVPWPGDWCLYLTASRVVRVFEIQLPLSIQPARLAGTDALCLPVCDVLLFPVLACAAGLGQEAPGCAHLG